MMNEITMYPIVSVSNNMKVYYTIMLLIAYTIIVTNI